MKSFFQSCEDWDITEWSGIYLGVSVENQRTADERIPILLQIPASHYFVSHEPALEMITIPKQFLLLGKKAWWIIGGETGPGARPMHPDIPRYDRDQCQAAGVPFFLKQWGEWIPKSHWRETVTKEFCWGTITKDGTWFESTTPWNGHDDDGSGEAIMVRVGKKKAGHLLDGKEWREFPK